MPLSPSHPPLTPVADHRGMVGYTGTIELDRSKMDDMLGLAVERSHALMSELHPIGNQDTRLMIVALSETGKRMLDAIVWFQGFRGQIEGCEAPSPALLEKVLDLIDETHDRVGSYHERLLDLAAEWSSRDANVVRYANLAAESASMLFDTLEALRWTVLERQADRDLDEQRVHRFDNAEEAIGFLRAGRH
jgi:hypothetical protein